MKRKLLAVICSVVMAMTMCVGVAWAETTTSYKAYQVFSGTWSEGTLSDIQWGEGVNGTALQTELATLPEFSDKTSAAEIAEVLDANQAMDNAVAKKFADVAAKYVKSDKGIATSINAADDPNKGNIEFTAPAAGYYLIMNDSVASDDSKTRIIVQAHNAGDLVSVSPKKSVPELIKKVKENNHSVTPGTNIGDGYNDVADYCIGDDVPFELIGTLPSTFDDYKTYKYTFHDKLSAGLTLNEGSIKVYIMNDTTSVPDLEGEDANTPVDAAEYDVVNTGMTDDCSFEIKFNDLQKESLGVTKDSRIFVYYTAKLGQGAVIGSDGNTNEATLEFSNNPNSGGEGDTGTTPPDKVVVFTFELDVHKYNGEDAEKANLAGATFRIWADADKAKAVKITQKDNVYYYAGTEDVSAESLAGYTANQFSTTSTGVIEIRGLDSGEYWLEETAAPDGFNKLTEMIHLKVEAATVNNQNWTGEEASDALTALTITAVNDTDPSNSAITSEDPTDGKVQADVENNAGSVLPSTGGIGTTIFYVVGACLVVIAGVALVAKRRAAARRK